MIEIPDSIPVLAECYVCGKHKECVRISPNQFANGERICICADCIDRCRNLVQKATEALS